MVWKRLVTLDDSQSIFDWRNDIDTRKTSIETNEVSWNDHMSWIKKKMDSEDCIMIIFGEEKENIGVVRLEKQDNLFEVSININPLYRKKGYGTTLLIESESFLSGYNEVCLQATIKESNLASIAVFTKAKYELFTTESTLKIYRKGL